MPQGNKSGKQSRSGRDGAHRSASNALRRWCICICNPRAWLDADEPVGRVRRRPRCWTRPLPSRRARWSRATAVRRRMGNLPTRSPMIAVPQGSSIRLALAAPDASKDGQSAEMARPSTAVRSRRSDDVAKSPLVIVLRWVVLFARRATSFAAARGDEPVMPNSGEAGCSGPRDTRHRQSAYCRRCVCIDGF